VLIEQSRSIPLGLFAINPNISKALIFYALKSNHVMCFMCHLSAFYL